MTNDKNTTGILFGTLIGFCLGAAAALLLAPKSGKELRGDIAEQYQKVSDGTQLLARRVGDKTSELVENFREAASAAEPSDTDKKPMTEQNQDIK